MESAVVTGTASGVGTAPAPGGPVRGNQHRPVVPGTTGEGAAASTKAVVPAAGFGAGRK
jgi:hypothetical protein